VENARSRLAYTSVVGQEARCRFFNLGARGLFCIRLATKKFSAGATEEISGCFSAGLAWRRTPSC